MTENFDLSQSGIIEIQEHLKDLLGIPRYDQNGKEACGVPTLVICEMKKLMEFHPSMTCAAALKLASERFAPAKIALALCAELLRLRGANKVKTKKEKVWEKQWGTLI